MDLTETWWCTQTTLIVTKSGVINETIRKKHRGCILTLDQATQIREKQLCGHWTAPERLAEAIATIRERIEPVSRSQYRKVTRASQRVVKLETT